MTLCFDRWVADTLVPFARTAIAGWDADFMHIWKGVERPHSPSFPILPTAGYWQLAKAGRSSQFATPSTLWPADATPSAHQTLLLKTQAPAFWGGLDAHLRAFDAPLSHRGILYGIGVTDRPDPQVLLCAKPRGASTYTDPLPFIQQADWATLRQAILSGTPPE